MESLGRADSGPIEEAGVTSTNLPKLVTLTIEGTDCMPDTTRLRNVWPCQTEAESKAGRLWDSTPRWLVIRSRWKDMARRCSTARSLCLDPARVYLGQVIPAACLHLIVWEDVFVN